MKKSRWSSILALTMALCGFGSAQSQELVIGVPLALTGPYAFAGVTERNGIELAFEQANAAGTLGALKIKPIFQDTASDKTQALTLASQFANRDKALAIVGYSSSIEGTAAAAVINQLKIPMVAIGVSDDILKPGPWGFRIPTLFDVSEYLAKYLTAQLKVKRLSVVYVRDNEAMANQGKYFSKVAMANGASILSDDGLLGTDVDMTSLATKITSLNPDAVFMHLPSEQAASLVTQLRQAGLAASVKITGMSSMAASAYIKAGGASVEGSVAAADYFIGSKSEVNRKFVDSYRAKYKIDPDNYAALGYTAATVALGAIKASLPKPDRDSVRNALKGTKDLPVVLGAGSLSLDENRAPHYGAALMKVERGNFVPLE